LKGWGRLEAGEQSGGEKKNAGSREGLGGLGTKTGGGGLQKKTRGTERTQEDNRTGEIQINPLGRKSGEKKPHKNERPETKPVARDRSKKKRQKVLEEVSGISRKAKRLKTILTGKGGEGLFG